MPFEPTFEDISLSQRKGIYKDGVKVECKTEVPSALVGKILNVTARSVITSSTITEKEIYYEGKVTFFVCYKDVEGALSKCECGAEFKGRAKHECGGNVKAQLNSCLDKIEADVSGIRLTIIGYVGVEANIIENKKVNVLSASDKLIVDSRERQFCKSYGQRESVYPLEEDFEIDYKVEEVLSQRALPLITAVQCGVGCIIVDGEVLFSAILLQSKEKNDIIREERILPFRAEIECEDAMPSMSATAFIQEKLFKTDISVDQTNGNTLIKVNVNLLLTGEVFCVENVNVIEDAFSTTQNVDIEKEEYLFNRPCEQRSSSKPITVSATTDSLPVGTTLACCLGEKIEVVSVDCVEAGIKIAGVLSINCLFKDSENQIFSRKLESPFDLLIETGCDCECDYLVKGTCHKVRARLLSNTEIEFSFEGIFCVYPQERCKISLIKSIKAVGEKKENVHAISVYIPYEGEELWSLAKRLNLSPQALLATNQDLQFPLSGKERIVVYRRGDEVSHN